MSIIGSVYVCISTYMLRHRSKQSHLMMHLISVASLTICCISIWVFIVSIPRAFSSAQPYSQQPCTIIGIFGQFCFMSSSCLYCLIGYVTWILISDVSSNLITGDATTPYHRLLDYTYDEYNEFYLDQTQLHFKLNKTVMVGGTASMLIVLVLTILPVIGNGYGDSIMDCWIKDTAYQLVSLVVISLCLLFCFIITLFSVYKLKKITNLSRYQDLKYTKKVSLIRVLLKFNVIFSVLLVFGLPMRIWTVTRKETEPPLVLVTLRYVGLCCIGLCNCVVWITSSLFQTFNQEKTQDNMRYSVRQSVHGRVTNGGNEQSLKSLYASGGSGPSDDITPKTYKLDACDRHSKTLNRYSKSFKPPGDGGLLDRSEIPKSAPPELGKKVTATSGIFDDDDFEFSIKSQSPLLSNSFAY
eukprot:75068_1